MALYVASNKNGSHYGDWVVKRDGIVKSNHRKKSKAIKKAKKLQENETIFVQKANGEFQRRILP